MLETHSDHYTAAANDLPGMTFTVQLAQTGPFSQLLVVINLKYKDGEITQLSNTKHVMIINNPIFDLLQ